MSDISWNAIVHHIGDTVVRDLRPLLAVMPQRASRAPRRQSVTSITLHYSGAAVPGFGDPEAELQHIIDIDVHDHQARLGADSLQFHYAVLSDGQIYLTREESLIAWHCGDAVGDERSLSIYLPLGGGQDATEAQWRATTGFFQTQIARHGLSSRNAILAHQEWSDTVCPGPYLMQRLRNWRSAEREGGVFRIKADIDAAPVRQGPARAFPVALNGKALMWPGDTFIADRVIEGEQVGAENRWAHREDGVGFVHLSLLDRMI